MASRITSMQVPDPTDPVRIEIGLDEIRHLRARRVRAVAWALLLAMLPPFILTPVLSRAKRAAAVVAGDKHERAGPSVKRPTPFVHHVAALPGS